MGDNTAANTIMGLKPGVGGAAALGYLKCVDSDASLQSGTNGDFAHDTNKLVQELVGSSSGYSNMVVWTRGVTQDCAVGVSNGTSTIAADLQPDDVKFAGYMVSGRGGNGFTCFSSVKEQVVLRLGGPPESSVVTGVWRLLLPQNGERPSQIDLLTELKQKYPALNVPDSLSGDQPTGIAGYTDETGSALDINEIEQDQYLSQPVEPQPPATTEGCGFLWLSRCSRTVPQSEIDKYDQDKKNYDAAMAAYPDRKAKADAYYTCVRTPPSSVGDPPLLETETDKCGPSYYAAAFPYPGGYVTAFFIGIYDQQTAVKARADLDTYIQQLRDKRHAPVNQPF